MNESPRWRGMSLGHLTVAWMWRDLRIVAPIDLANAVVASRGVLRGVTPTKETRPEALVWVTRNGVIRAPIWATQ